jgi:hypothetical protein
MRPLLEMVVMVEQIGTVVEMQLTEMTLHLMHQALDLSHS